jgi:hypothetical protein
MAEAFADLRPLVLAELGDLFLNQTLHPSNKGERGLDHHRFHCNSHTPTPSLLQLQAGNILPPRTHRYVDRRTQGIDIF